jgi:hypothetical protein
MLSLILQIWLTKRAWQSGWGAAALIPVAVAYPLAFLLGLVMALSQVELSEGAVFAVGFLIELTCIASLALMCARKSEAPQPGQAEPVAPAAPAEA